jgi:hypothetical protein
VKKSTNRKKALLISITPFVFTRPALEMKQAKKKTQNKIKNRTNKYSPKTPACFSLGVNLDKI